MEDNNNNSNKILCYLNIVSNDNDNDNIIKWMEIKETSDDNKVLFYIPYINKFKGFPINNFQQAVYKEAILLPESWDEQIETLINYIYDNCRKIIITKNSPKEKSNRIHIDLSKSYYTYTQLYFLNKLSRIGFTDINKDEMFFDYQNSL